MKLTITANVKLSPKGVEIPKTFAKELRNSIEQNLGSDIVDAYLSTGDEVDGNFAAAVSAIKVTVE